MCSPTQPFLSDINRTVWTHHNLSSLAYWHDNYENKPYSYGQRTDRDSWGQLLAHCGFCTSSPRDSGYLTSGVFLLTVWVLKCFCLLPHYVKHLYTSMTHSHNLSLNPKYIYFNTCRLMWRPKNKTFQITVTLKQFMQVGHKSYLACMRQWKCKKRGFMGGGVRG